MPIDWNAIEKVADQASADFLSIVKPYLPALGRAGQGVFDGFIRHMLDKNWAAVDALMYEHMTIAERRDLEDQALKELRQAAIDRYNRLTLTKDICFKVALRVLMTLAL